MKLALIGLGQTGKFVAKYFMEQGALQVVFCRDKSRDKNVIDHLGIVASGIEIANIQDLEASLRMTKPDVFVDFSRADFLREHIVTIAKCGVSIVTAITEYSKEDLVRFKQVAERYQVGFMIVPNITYGVNVMMFMAQMAARLMEDYDFEIIEEHHNQKKDIPSGTAKKIAYKVDEILMKHCDYKYKNTPVHSIRSGGLVGKHKLIIVGKYDKIELSHESFSKMAFAEGAYKAARFIQGRIGFYEMDDLFAHGMKKKPKLECVGEAI